MGTQQILRNSLMELPSSSDVPLITYNPAAEQDIKDSFTTLGQPCTKSLVSRTHLTVSAISLICFVLGSLAITPNLSIAWHLQFSGQIVIIGFLLSIMNLCLQTILPYTFLLFEARFGQSRLQNFDAILTGKLLSSDIAFPWRLILLLFMILPIALSISYKRLLGGSSDAEISRTVRYGIDFPRVRAWAPPNDPIYFLTTSVSAFLSTSQYSPQPYPSVGQFPVAFGYNTLLLNNESAAILDTPTAPFVSYLQGQLSAGETLEIIAPVDAFLSTIDRESDFVTNNATWNSDVKSAFTGYGWAGLSIIDLYQTNGSHIGMLRFGPNHTQIYFGLYYNSSYTGLGLLQSTNDLEYQLFRKSARRYNMSRTRCQGHWHLNASSILLTGGSCQVNQKLDRRIFFGIEPYYIDAMPDMQHIFGSFVGTNGFEQMTSPDWLEATYSVVVATIYWSRALFLLGGSGTKRSDWTGYSGSYLSTEQTIISTRKTLRGGLPLFLVLAVQPIITILALLVTIWLFDVPLGTGFGIISILSGFKPSSSSHIGGAGLSGKLSTPVKLDVMPTNPLENGESVDTVITYRVVDVSKKATRRNIQRKRAYG